MWSNKEADFFPEINKSFTFPWNGPTALHETYVAGQEESGCVISPNTDQ